MKAAALSLDRTQPRPPAPVSFFEFWPGWAFYTPIVIQWLALGLRYGDFSLPTAANPRIEVGGLCGESKTGILDQVGPSSRHLLAPYLVLDEPDPDAAIRAVDQASLDWPMVVKPDIGCNGTGVRLVAGPAELERYLAEFPRGARVMCQRYVPWEGEAGLFYIRRPGQRTGTLTSITLKHTPSVIGDGRSSLRELILADPRAQRARHQYFPRLADRLDDVPEAGETVRLVFVGNHCKGAVFTDGRDHATPELTARIDALAQSMPEFHFGRLDVRYRSLAALRRGEDFSVIEINGIGSEATHVWDARTRLMDAWRDELAHFRAAFEIGRANRARGIRPSGVMSLLRHWRLQRRLMKSYPVHD